MKTSVFRKVLVADRLPELGTEYVTTFAHSKAGASTYSLVNERVLEHIKIHKEYWLEEVELPNDSDLDTEAYNNYSKSPTGHIEYVTFLIGANFILNKLKK